jgi:hypothetical protein
MQNKKKPGRPCDTTPVGPESEVGIWVYSYSRHQLNTHYQKIMFSKNCSRNDANTPPPEKKPNQKISSKTVPATMREAPPPEQNPFPKPFPPRCDEVFFGWRCVPASLWEWFLENMIF